MRQRLTSCLALLLLLPALAWGQMSVSGPLSMADGDSTDCAPIGLGFAADTDTGFVRMGANRLGICTAGSVRWEFDASGNFVGATGLFIGLGSAAGRVVITDAATDTVAVMDANVGIGTVSPLALGGAAAKTLHVSASQFPQLILETTTALLDNKVWRLIARDTNFFQIQTLNDAGISELTALEIERNGNLIVDVSFPNGNVGIGLINPAHLLDLALGTLTAQKAAWNAIGTWNSGATTFVAEDTNITDSASAAGSLLRRWQVGSVKIAALGKAGNWEVNGRPNGQLLGMKTATELHTLALAATSDTTITAPANSLVLGVTIRVTTEITGCTTLDLGVAGATTRYGTGIALTAGTTNASPGTTNPTIYGAATAIRFSAVGGGASFTAGIIRVTIHYLDLTAPTSWLMLEEQEALGLPMAA